MNMHASPKNVMVLKFGFTGTRKGMSQPQKNFVQALLKRHGGQLHHGDCIGADAEAHELAKALGCHITVHPPANEEYRAHKAGDVILPPAGYDVRNAQIVLSSDVLIAAPANQLEVGGTWRTINFFRRFMEGHATCGKQGYIVLPSGVVGTIETKRSGLGGTFSPKN